MKGYLLSLVLIMLIGLSGAIASDLQLQTGYNLAGLDMNSISASSGSTVTVEIKDNSFKPSLLNVPVGTTVVWHNNDALSHSVVSDIQGQFESGKIKKGEEFAFTFNSAGSFSYHCGIHQGMKGTVTVKETAAATGTQLPSSVLATSGQPGQFTQLNSQKTGSASWSELPISTDGQKAALDSVSSSQQTSKMIMSVEPAGLVSDQVYAQTSDQTYDRFNNGGYSQSDLEKFSQYYSQAAEKPAQQLSAPAKISLNEVEPETLYFGSQQKSMAYSQYKSNALASGTNSLWIAGTSSWTQYAVVPLGSEISMIAISPSGGHGYLYEIYPDGTLYTNSYSLYPYNEIGFYADEVGEHQMFFNINGQPSNVIVIYVVPYQQVTPPAYNMASITISSTWLRGYNIYLDGNYVATEGMTGDPDGTVTIDAEGDKYHNIAIDGSGFTFSDYKYFKAGYAYKLNV
jgi:plastocyanin